MSPHFKFLATAAIVAVIFFNASVTADDRIALNPQPEPPSRTFLQYGTVRLSHQLQPPRQVGRPQYHAFHLASRRFSTAQPRRMTQFSTMTPNTSRVEAQMEQVRSRRQMTQTAFQNANQKANQTLNQLGNVAKAMNESRMATVRNLQ